MARESATRFGAARAMAAGQAAARLGDGERPAAPQRPAGFRVERHGGGLQRTPLCAAPDGVDVDLTEVHEAMARFRELGIGMVCVTGGSPYYNPHIQRPAYFPPSDGYHPPDDPLLDVVRLIDVAAELAHEHRDLAVVGSGYSYLQDFVGHVGQAVVRRGDAASVGLGRMMLSYPEMPADLLAGRPLNRRQVCRTLSDCTTAPRNGLVSGCYPFDEFYKERPERVELAAAKRTARQAAPA